MSYARWRFAGSPPPPETMSDLDAWLSAFRGVVPAKRRPDLSVTVITPVFNPPSRLLTECIESVIGQTHPNWRMILVDDVSSAPDTIRTLRDAAERDERIQLIRLNSTVETAAATNAGLAAADGEFVVLLDHGDVLAPTALDWVASVATEADLIYSDEDKMDETGHHHSPIFKPSWSPRLLLGINYVRHLAAIRTSVLEELGGLREGYEGVQNHDLLLRLAELPGLRVAHLPNILYHSRTWDSATDGSAATEQERVSERRGLELVQETLDRRGIAAKAHLGTGIPFNYRPIFDAQEHPPTVKVVIPTRDRLDLLEEAVTGVLERTDGASVALVVVDNGSRDPATLDYLETLSTSGTASVLRIDDAFNFSRLCNEGAGTGPETDYILFLNNDVVIVHRRWLQQLIGWLDGDSTVVGVGTKLISQSGRIQHAGVVVGLGGIAGHYATGLLDEPELGNLHDQAREVGALTAACLLVRADDFETVGGFSDCFPADFGDVDLCLRLRHRLGGVLMYDPTFPLIHHQSASREVRSSGYIQARFRHLWDEDLRRCDPYYNPHLSPFTHLDPTGTLVIHEPNRLRDIPDSPVDRLNRVQPRTID